MSKQVSVNVIDPDKMISWLAVCCEHPDIVVVYGDMNAKGKRAEVDLIEKTSWRISSDPERGNYTAEVTLENLPFGNFIEIHSGTSKYSLFIVLMARKSLAEPRYIHAAD